MKSWDVIVIGLGAMGGAAACHCARRGARVLGLDANPPGHALGSSHGATRAIREAHFEAPEYVPLVQRAYDLWRELEQETDRSLLSISGAVYLGPPGHPMLEGMLEAARQHDLACERLSAGETMARFPGFALPGDWQAVYEPRGGVLQAADCLQAHLDLAERHGAELRFSLAAQSWRQTADGVVVETAEGPVRAGSVVLTPGLWACELPGFPALPLSGRRITVVHFDATDPGAFDAAGMSVYFWATPEGIFAGFPHFDGEGVKIMRHDRGEVCTPGTVRREVNAADIEEVSAFARRYMPGAHGPVRKAHVCLYTMTPDNLFVIDRHPEMPGIVQASGFSGAGFKFAPVVGEILADLALDGETRHPVGFLSAARFSVPDRAAG